MKAYIIKLELVGSEPLVWRRVIMPAGATFNRLHDVIQTVTNFQSGYPCEDYHLYEFDLKEEKIRVTNDEEAYQEHLHYKKNRKAYAERLRTMSPKYAEFEKAYQERLQMVVRKPAGLKIDNYLEKHKEILYRYDFGDGWQFIIRLEDIVDDYYFGYPTLLDGAETAPPEDVGGIPGFYDFLEAYRDEKHPEHKAMKAWADSLGFKEYEPEWINEQLKGIVYKKTEWVKINHNNYKIIEDKYRSGMFRQEESVPAKEFNSKANADISHPNSAAFSQDAGLPTPATEEGKQPSGKEWEALFTAAQNFKEAKCWGWMDDSDLFGVKDPESGTVAYCSIMGKLGEHFALGAYLGAEGLYSFLRMQDSANPEEMRENYFGQKCLMASFEDREQLSERDRSIIKETGLKFRGKKQWPLFRSLKPGYYPWYITAWECRFLTVCLEQAVEVARLCFESKAILNRFENGRELMLLRASQKKGQEIVWVNEHHFPEVFSKEYSVYGVSDELTLRKLLNSLKKGSATWEADLFFSPVPVQEKKDARPYFPTIFLVADLSTGLLIGYTMLVDLKTQSNEIAETLINSIQSSEKIPNRIAVEKEETRFFLAKICSQLDIKLELVEQLQMIPEVRAELLKGNF